MKTITAEMRRPKKAGMNDSRIPRKRHVSTNGYEEGLSTLYLYGGWEEVCLRYQSSMLPSFSMLEADELAGKRAIMSMAAAPP
jgi:hypothetical protein